MGVRYDKYDPISGGFRAKLNANLSPDANGEVGPVGVSLNTSGRVLVGGAETVGVLVKNSAREGASQYSTGMQGAPNPAAFIGQMAGDVVDIMTSGEIVGLTPLGLTPGANIFADATDGSLTEDDNTGANRKVGFMVEADRLIVRL
jgi:hypothetical protein